VSSVAIPVACSHKSPLFVEENNPFVVAATTIPPESTSISLTQELAGIPLFAGDQVLPLSV